MRVTARGGGHGVAAPQAGSRESVERAGPGATRESLTREAYRKLYNKFHYILRGEYPSAPGGAAPASGGAAPAPGGAAPAPGGGPASAAAVGVQPGVEGPDAPMGGAGGGGEGSSRDACAGVPPADATLVTAGLEEEHRGGADGAADNTARGGGADVPPARDEAPAQRGSAPDRTARAEGKDNSKDEDSDVHMK